MAHVKSSEIPHYELLCLISNKFSETEVEPIRKTISKLVSDQGGKITFEEFWGKRKLAYPVGGFRHGYYYLLEFDIDGPKLIEVTNRLRLSNDILRHQLVKKHRKTAGELAEDQKIQQKIAARRKAEAEAGKEDNRTDLENLDKDIDKIIDASNLL